MSRIKLVIAAIAAMFIFSAVASSMASAATAGWMVNGTMLTGSKALATTAKVTQPGKLEAAGVVITCQAETLKGVGPEIIAPSGGKATSITFSECGITAGECTLGSPTITTTPVLVTELTLEGALAVHGHFVPHLSSIFATIKYEGAKCALLGVQPVKGKVLFLAHTGQDERTLQLVLISNATNELVVGSSSANISGAGELRLASGEPWSYL